MKRLICVPILGGIIAAIIICGMSGARNYSNQVTQMLEKAEYEMIQGNSEKAAKYAASAEKIYSQVAFSKEKLRAAEKSSTH